MNLELSTPALLFPAIAILMLGYVNRYIGAANVIRSFKKDYDSGYKHNDLTKQLNILKKRIELMRGMLLVGASSLILACLSMLFIFVNNQLAGKGAFGLSLLGLVLSLFASLYETSLSNRSLILEIDDMIHREK